MKFTWKNFPENPLSHPPKLQNLKKVWKSFPEYPLSHAPIFGKIFRDLPIWVNPHVGTILKDLREPFRIEPLCIRLIGNLINF